MAQRHYKPPEGSAAPIGFDSPFLRCCPFWITRVEFLTSTRRMYSEVVSPVISEARMIRAQVSSSTRIDRFGVWPVAGLPLPRGTVVSVSILQFYVIP